jgi:hypothetical protein
MKIFENFTRIKNEFDKNLMGIDDICNNQDDDNNSIIRTPRRFYGFQFNKNHFNEIVTRSGGKTKTITVNIVNDKYTIETRSYQQIGDLRKTIGLWTDIQPNKFVLENDFCWSDNELIWKAAAKGGVEFKIKFQRNSFSSFMHEIICYKPKKVIFKEGEYRLQLQIHEELKIRTVKEVVLHQLKKEGCWIKFLLNEKLFIKENRIPELPPAIDLIEMNSFVMQRKTLEFHYSNDFFRLEFDNSLEIGGIEATIRDQTGIGDDVEFYDYGERKIHKGEFVQEHNVIKLFTIDRNMKREPCKFKELNLEVYIGKMKFNLMMQCFKG